MNKYMVISLFSMSFFGAYSMENAIERLPKEVQDHLISYAILPRFIKADQGGPSSPLRIDAGKSLKLDETGSLQICTKTAGWRGYVWGDACQTLIQSYPDISGFQNVIGIFSLSHDKKRVVALRDGKEIITFELDTPTDEKSFSLEQYAQNEGAVGQNLTSDNLKFIQQSGFSWHRKPIKQVAISNNGEYLVFANDHDVFLSVNQQPYKKINQEADKLIKYIGLNKEQSLIGWKYAEHANAGGSYKLPEYKGESGSGTSMKEHFKKIGVKKELQNFGSQNR